jgi:hypothetical protein
VFSAKIWEIKCTLLPRYLLYCPDIFTVLPRYLLYCPDIYFIAQISLSNLEATGGAGIIFLSLDEGNKA